MLSENRGEARTAGATTASTRTHRDTTRSMMSTTCAPHDAHSHTHAPDCGHVAVDHGDHVDYLHDGHAHSVHGDHYDECSLDDVHVVATPHDHVHGPDCGHETMTHGDHTDYIHDGHRHAVHGDHYDEH